MKNRILNVGNITKVGILTAAALLLSIIELPIRFAPDFYKIDLSSTVVLLGSYIVGPLAGIIIAVLKTVLKALIAGTTTAFVGEYVDIIITILYVFPAAITYRNHKSLKNAILGMLVGIVSMTFFGCLLNYFLLIPVYARIAGLPVEHIVSATSLLNTKVSDLKSLVLFVTAPFNVMKGTVCSIAAYLCLLPLKKLINNQEQ